MDNIRHKRLLYILLGITLLCPLLTSSKGQTPNASSVFDAFNSSILKIRNAVKQISIDGGQKAAINELLSSIEQNIAFLRETARRQRSIPVPDEYIRALSHDAELLSALADQIVNQSFDVKMLNSALLELASDLTIKANYAKSSRSAALRLVRLYVYTRKGDSELTGYEVWYVPKAWEGVNSAHRRFDKLSSPTWMDVAPGNYIIWAQKAKLTTEKRPISVGSDDKSEKKFDLLVP